MSAGIGVWSFGFDLAFVIWHSSFRRTFDESRELMVRKHWGWDGLHPPRLGPRFEAGAVFGIHEFMKIEKGRGTP